MGASPALRARAASRREESGSTTERVRNCPVCSASERSRKTTTSPKVSNPWSVRWRATAFERSLTTRATSSPAMRSRSCGLSITVNRFGASRRPPASSWTWSSASRFSAPVISWGTTLPPKIRAEASPTIPWRRRSNLPTRPTDLPPFAPACLIAPPIVSVLALGVGADRVPRCGCGGERRASFSIARASGGMADAHGSGPCVRKDVRVQLPPRPQFLLPPHLRTAGRSGWSASTSRSAIFSGVFSAV